MSEEWKISHPGTRELITVESFEQAMDKWFEGFNPPRLLLNGAMESFTMSHKRVEEYYTRSRNE